MSDPNERDNVLFPNTWVPKAALPQLEEYMASLKNHPPIPTRRGLLLFGDMRVPRKARDVLPLPDRGVQLWSNEGERCHWCLRRSDFFSNPVPKGPTRPMCLRKNRARTAWLRVECTFIFYLRFAPSDASASRLTSAAV